MKGTAKLATAFAAAAVLVLSGAFAVSAQRHKKAKIAAETAACEREITRLKLENEELAAKIAELENPVWLAGRVGTEMSLPRTDEDVVWAYENFEGGRVEFANTPAGTVSFRPGAKR